MDYNVSPSKHELDMIASQEEQDEINRQLSILEGKITNMELRVTGDLNLVSRVVHTLFKRKPTSLSRSNVFNV